MNEPVVPAGAARADAGSLCDVAGLKLGHYTHPSAPTGCSVVLCEAGATAGVDVRGAAPGTRETDLLRPENTVQQIHAVLLSGGSAFGLAAADGVMRWLAERGHGFPVGQVRVPIDFEMDGDRGEPAKAASAALARQAVARLPTAPDWSSYERMVRSFGAGWATPAAPADEC